MKKNNLPHISIIIPVLNEEANLLKLIPYLRSKAEHPEKLELIIVDGGSSDNSAGIARSLDVTVIRAPKGRASQMNSGARSAKGNILYFLHADSKPPKAFDWLICQAVNENIPAGCFRLRFDSPSYFLGIFAWFSRFNFLICRGGDQSLFITSTFFKELGGFDNRYQIYEDNELIGRIYRRSTFKVLPQYLITSARKYSLNGMFRLQYHFARIHFMYFTGKSPEVLCNYYDKHIKQT